MADPELGVGAAMGSAAGTPLVDVADLTKSYTTPNGAIPVLRGLSLRVARGEMVAIVGASGVGKSTLLHVLGGLDRAERGTVRVAGEDIGALSDDALVAFRNRHVGFVFQFHHLLPDFSAEENVILPQLLLGVGRSEAEVRARDLLGALGLAHRLTHRPSQLSGGEQQRVAVARALANKPLLVLADEPTGNLDETTSDKVFAQFLELVRGQGSSALVATHNERLAARMDRVVRLSEGRLV